MKRLISNSKTPIFATKVPVRERMRCFAGLFEDHFIDTENAVYSFAENIVVGYRGEFWDFYRLSNGGFFISPRKALLYDVMTSFANQQKCFIKDFRGEMSARATGLVVCIYAYEFMTKRTSDPVFEAQSWLLKEYAVQHPERTKIMAAIYQEELIDYSYEETELSVRIDDSDKIHPALSSCFGWLLQCNCPCTWGAEKIIELAKGYGRVDCDGEFKRQGWRRDRRGTTSLTEEYRASRDEPGSRHLTKPLEN